MKQIALPRNAAPIALVALLHAAALWALASGHTISVQEPQPIEISIELGTAAPTPVATAKIAPAAPMPVLPAKAAPAARTAPAKAAAENVATDPAPAVQTHKPAAVESTATAIAATTAVPSGASNASAVASSSANSAGTPGAQAATPSASALQLPSSDADYLNNPRPAYPPMSRRLGEQGTVVVRALIGADGVPQKAEVQQSSGFERLDRAAVETALKWRYVPGKRAGIAEAMWFKVPLRFVLE